MDDIRGLVTASPMLGWGLVLGTLGDPRDAAVRRLRERVPDPRHGDRPSSPGRRLFPAASLGLAFAAVFSKVQPMVFGATTGERLPRPPAMIPVFVHLGLVLLLGLWIPPFLADWYRRPHV